MSRFKDWKEPYFDDAGFAYKYDDDILHSTYGWRCQYPENLTLGKNVDIGCYTYINAKYGIEIGDDVQLGAHCAVYSDNTEDETHGKVSIGENSLIGAYTLILPRSVIPPNSKIKARSIITYDIENAETIMWRIPDIGGNVHPRAYTDLWSVLE